jgi:hypothetical protein
MRNPSFRDAKHAFRFGLLSVHTTPERNRPGRLPLSCGTCDVDRKAYLAATNDAAIQGHRRCPSSLDCFVAIALKEGRASLVAHAPRHDGSTEREKLRKRAVKLLKSFVSANLWALPRKPAPWPSPIASAVRPFPLLVAGAPWPSRRLEAPSRHRRGSQSRP